MRSLQSLLINGFWLGAFAALLHCNSGEDIAGSGTETGNVTGVVTSGSQNSPVSGTQLKLFRKKSSIASPEQDFVPLEETITDENGRFSFDMESGTYTIVAASEDQYSFVDNILPGSERAKKLEVQLQNAGTIKGSIENTLELRGGTSQVVVHLIGTDFYTNVRIDGSFELSEVPAGKYRLVSYTTKINDFSPDYRSVTVKPDSVSNVGTYQLPFSGIPIPKNVSVRYDPALGANIVTWSPVVGYVDFQEYVIMRDSVANPDLGLRNIASTKDTFFIDKIDFSYGDKFHFEYSIKVRSKFEEEGAFYGKYSALATNPELLIATMPPVSLTYDTLTARTTLSWTPLDGNSQHEDFGGYLITRSRYSTRDDSVSTYYDSLPIPAYIPDSLRQTDTLGIVQNAVFSETLTPLIQVLPPESIQVVIYSVAVYHVRWKRGGKAVQTTPIIIKKP
jgi:hypothetical protein